MAGVFIIHHPLTSFLNYVIDYVIKESMRTGEKVPRSTP